MDNTELCVNLWYCIEQQTGFIDAIAGRGYMLSGTDDQKKSVLQGLAAHDHINATWLPIPETYVASVPDEDGNYVNLPGLMHISELDSAGINAFECAFKEIENVEQQYLPAKDNSLLKVPDEMLFVMTAVENKDGMLKAVIDE